MAVTRLLLFRLVPDAALAVGDWRDLVFAIVSMATSSSENQSMNTKIKIRKIGVK